MNDEKISRTVAILGIAFVLMGSLYLLTGCQGDTIVNEGNTTTIIEAPEVIEAPVVEPREPIVIVMPAPVVEEPEEEIEVEIPVVIQPIVDPVADQPTNGYASNPRPFFENGSYEVNAPEYDETYFISNIIDAGMTITVNPKLTNLVYDVRVYSSLYAEVDPVTFIGTWTFLVADKDYYIIEIRTYEAVEVVLSVDGWN